MVQKKIQSVKKMVDALVKTDVNDLDFGKAVSLTKTESHQLVEEMSRDLRVFANDILNAEKVTADHSFMKNDVEKLYQAFDNDQAEIKQAIQRVIAQHKREIEESHAKNNH